MTAPTRPRQKSPPKYEQIAPRVAELAADGLTRNEIARRLDSAPSTVTRAARHAGVTFDTTPVEAAHAVTIARHTATRAELADLAAGIASDAGHRLRAELAAHVLDGATMRGLATTFGIATDKVIAFAATLPSAEEAQSKGALDALMGAIMSAASPTRTTDLEETL